MSGHRGGHGSHGRGKGGGIPSELAWSRKNVVRPARQGGNGGHHQAVRGVGVRRGVDVRRVGLGGEGVRRGRRPACVNPLQFPVEVVNFEL